MKFFDIFENVTEHEKVDMQAHMSNEPKKPGEEKHPEEVENIEEENLNIENATVEEEE